MIETINQMPPMSRKIPDIHRSEDVEKAARNFTSVFFNECVNIMLEEARDPEEDFSGEVYRTLHSQILGEKMVESPAGRNIVNMLVVEISKMQERQHNA